MTTVTPITLTTKECLTLLGVCDIGRIVVVHEGYPVALPVNYTLARMDGNPVIAVRTRTGNTLDHPDELVGFEIDGVDQGHDGGWSVLVRGRLTSIVPRERLDPHPILQEGRDAWRIIVPHEITGRRIPADPLRWAFHPAGYL